jgi:4-diphosphocytidyl-2-C-methyl-D-erythritol kinase
MVYFPPCKINLGLHVIQKRADGYHDLETCFYPVPCTDILEIISSDTLKFTASGLPISGAEEDNLCIKAYKLLQSAYDIPPVHIHLHKVIPMGAGLGGGSSDAAYTLRLLNDKYNLGLNKEALMKYAALLGSDCAFFIQDKPMLGTGRGEVLEEVNVDLSGRYLVLLKPPIHVSTAEAYQGVKPQKPDVSLRHILAEANPDSWKSRLVNDFERSVFARHPAIETLKAMLYNQGAWYASMSGSGSCVFGIFEKEIDYTYTGLEFLWRGYL